MRRLFSTFAHGAPGLGLLLLRSVGGIVVVVHTVVELHRKGPLGSAVLDVFTGFVGILLLIGLWTPITGSLLAILALASALHDENPLNWILLGTFGAALAMLGPGGWSVDAHLFGWKRVELPDRKS